MGVFYKDSDKRDYDYTSMPHCGLIHSTDKAHLFDTTTGWRFWVPRSLCGDTTDNSVEVADFAVIKLFMPKQ